MAARFIDVRGNRPFALSPVPIFIADLLKDERGRANQDDAGRDERFSTRHHP
jgi:hypothetical protein